MDSLLRQNQPLSQQEQCRGRCHMSETGQETAYGLPYPGFQTRSLFPPKGGSDPIAADPADSLRLRHKAHPPSMPCIHEYRHRGLAIRTSRRSLENPNALYLRTLQVDCCTGTAQLDV